MELCDYIQCDAKLSGNPPHMIELLAQYGVAQTKSLGCKMRIYTITADGDLLRAEYKSEIVPEEQRYFCEKPEWEVGQAYHEVEKKQAKIIGETKLADYEGIIAFSVMPAGFRAYFYTARFVKGKLQAIVRVEGV